MSKLAQTQDIMMDYLLTQSPQQQQAAEQLLQQGGAIAPAIRLQIYANAYRIRLQETIETDHEQLCLYLGDELFAQMLDGYLSAYPSRHRSLRQFCDNLPQFLRQDAFFSQYPLLAELAQFERLLLTAYDAADAPREAFTTLQQLPAALWPATSLRLHPSVQLFTCQTPAVECWQALKQQQSPPNPDSIYPRCWLLWRGNSRVTEFISLQPYQQALLEGVLNGQDFAALCENMLIFSEPQQAPALVLQSFQAWFDMGLIRQVVSP
ncbi:DUF2063 domain-containing protein [Shewanella sp. NFH-SH190041]|uniref:HvfC/BufC N-terminal domain-containing protein n=1 Tax=Shewanella sp. NFH-SH190041 TaxID=2950245 RepID=UPI0021C28B31|nr:DNA-binding domain-containing protein [Shewanella sp. NFH-SH190041]BDM65612.1 DUF2063 domain-containing protein [Shewanella sp. NFH-SH190041]